MDAQDGRERTLAFSGSLVATTQTMDEFVAGNDVYARWKDDDWFKQLVGACNHVIRRLYMFPS